MIGTEKRPSLVALIAAGAWALQYLDSAIINTSLPQTGPVSAPVPSSYRPESPLM